MFISLLRIEDVDESISNHSDSEILDITLNNITSSSHHQNIDRKRKLTNIPHIDTILLSKINDDPTEEDKKIAEVVDQPEYYETSRKASDISNISKLSYGSSYFWYFNRKIFAIIFNIFP